MALLRGVLMEETFGIYRRLSLLLSITAGGDSDNLILLDDPVILVSIRGHLYLELA